MAVFGQVRVPGLEEARERRPEWLASARFQGSDSSLWVESAGEAQPISFMLHNAAVVFAIVEVSIGGTMRHKNVG